MILMIDNYDSFTYNLVQYLNELGQQVEVFRNDKISSDEIAQMAPDHIIISPGPGTPDSAGVTLEVISRFAGEIAIFGVCLGMQALAQAFGAKIVQASNIRHGKTSLIHHQQQGVFKDLDNPFVATRYHSLAVERDNLPQVLEEIAWTDDIENNENEIMGLRHRECNASGVQFHPESILSENGHRLLQNFLDGNT